MIMTTSRLARAGRSRFFIGIGILLLMVGFVAIFHSSQQQLDELRQMGRRCEQQHEAISSQLQTEVEKNFRLEKSLEGERLSHQQNRVELQQKAREEKEIREKSTKESNSRLASLQQHYKLLQSQHDDLQESCSKSHQKQLEEINGLQRKLENLRQGEKQKDKEIEHWKVKYKALEIEKINLEGAFKAKGGSLSDSLKVAHLERVVEQFEAHCAFRPDTLEHHVSNSPSSGRVHPDNEKNFNAQLTVSEDLYKIPIKINRMTTGAGPEGERMAIANSHNTFQMIPRPNDKGINSANVLQEPPSAQVAVKSSTATLDRRQSPLSQGNALPIAVIPTVLSSTKKTPDVLHKTKSRAVPQGVVPVPESMKELLKEEETQNAEMSPRSPDRYSNAMVDSVQQAPKKEDTRPEGEANFQNVNEVDNGAHEVDDFNIVEDKNHRDHLQDVLDDEKLNVNANNAAEEDTNLYDTNKIPLNRQKPNDDIDLEIINRRNPHLEANGEKHKYANDKLMNEEVAADQGFDLAAEEQVEEGDDDEYSNLAALHQQGQVVRN
ncbi:Golgi integral membrane protein 4-like isoform X1 [Phlebotomus argentipes]|uniref:Golgi integral membrane protein 4-like isoform X1 n=1 Tax=Phlebotomus argentipes TaxID=94469 RepID=UPI00289353E1|nr:Golgi integral membrane protein 4-like isoform X1 [Phlebotomus argentipes]